MSTVSAPRLTRHEAGWFALALAVHAVLLLLPLERSRPAVDSPRLLPISLNLAPRRMEAAPRSETAAQTEREPDRPEKSNLDLANETDPVARGAATPDEPPAEESAPEPAPLTAPRSLSTTDLLQAMGETTLASPGPSRPRMLGRPPTRDGPGAATPRNPLGESISGSFKTTSPVVVDRWLAQDGSHHVVVELPNGQTLCGRASAWDPMKPLVEHVMMFRSCAGGGPRSFSMPEERLPKRLAPR